MSNDPKSGGGPGDFDLDWGDALGDWDDGGKPLDVPPAASVAPGEGKPEPAPSRPLYRPPSSSNPPQVLSVVPARVSSVPAVPGTQPMPALSAPPGSAPASDSLFDGMEDELPTRVPRSEEEVGGSFLDFDDDASGATRVANIPRELIDSLLLARDEALHDTPTRPPPPPAPTGAPAGDASRAGTAASGLAPAPETDDDDIDAMLSVLDIGREPAPSVVPAVRPAPIAPLPPRVPSVARAAPSAGPDRPSAPRAPGSGASAPAGPGAPRPLPVPRALSAPPRPLASPRAPSLATPPGPPVESAPPRPSGPPAPLASAPPPAFASAAPIPSDGERILTPPSLPPAWSSVPPPLPSQRVSAPPALADAAEPSAPAAPGKRPLSGSLAALAARAAARASGADSSAGSAVSPSVLPPPLDTLGGEAASASHSDGIPGDGDEAPMFPAHGVDASDAAVSFVDDSSPGLDIGAADASSVEVASSDVDASSDALVASSDVDASSDALVASSDVDASSDALVASSEVLPEASAAPDAAPDAPVITAPATAARPDRGAATALRTVRTRKPRAERFPLVGRAPDALRARAMLLVDLAERVRGGARARLLSAAAEHLGQLGRGDEARALWAQAREADPTDVYVLRTLRRDAVVRGAWAEVATLLEAEAALPLEAGERGLVLAAIAEVRGGALGDRVAARAAAQGAADARPAAVVAALLLAEECAAAGDVEAAEAARERAAGLWTDLPGRAALLVDAARAAERAGDAARAAGFYGRAAGHDPSALDAALGLARAARRQDDTDTAAAALGRAVERAGDTRIAAALRYAAARFLDRGAGRSAEALHMLAGADGLDAARARAEAAGRAGDREARTAALVASAAAVGGTARALALLELADERAAAGEFEGADHALRDAALADPSLGVVRVVRDVLARQAGDASRLPLTVEAADGDAPGAALTAAAKAVREAGPSEREWVAAAAREGVDPLLVDVLSLDVAAAAGDADELGAALRRRAERVHPEARVGAFLALSEHALSRGDATEAAACLAAARGLTPGAPIVLRALARVAVEGAADAWLEEAAGAAGTRAAFAATMAGRARVAAGDDAATPLRQALDVVPGYGPALWALESVARARADHDLLREAHEGLAARAVDPRERAGRYVRAALLQPMGDVTPAIALYAQARGEVPGDAVIDDLLSRFSAELPPAERAALVEAACEGAEGEWLRAARLRAAAAWEDAGEPARALTLVRAVLAEGPDAFALAVRDRLEIAAGALALVADRRFEAVRDAADDAARVQALEALADLDLRERGDAASAMLSLQALLELAPGHIPSLRALERHFLAQGRDEDLVGVAQKLVAHLGDPNDLAGLARFAAQLQLSAPDASGDAADELLLGVASRARLDLWLARRVEAAAQARGASSAQLLAARAVAALLATPAERASATLRVAELLERTGAPGEAAQALGEAVQLAPEHPVAAEELARLRLDSADPRGAAEALESAARAARVPRRIARLWHRAGVLWQDEADDASRALAALEEAAKVDVAHADVFERLAALLEQRGDLRRLAGLTAERVAAGGEPAAMVALHERTAAICEKLGDAAGASASLRAALALDPERLEALRRLADLCAAGGDWRGAAEACIRIAKLTKELDELRDVFARLGVIYDDHIPDPKRAEAAYRRVLKLAPTDLTALARLARLYEREQQWASALEALKQLAAIDPDPDQLRQHRLDLARTHEALGQPREAETALEAVRRAEPTDLEILRTIAAFYERQNAQAALAMHLNRGVNDVRQALDADLTDAAAWQTLVALLASRGRTDAARVAASTAQAVGVALVDAPVRLDATGGVPGAGGAAAEPELEELLASSTLLPLAARQVFRLAGDAIDKTIPALDLKAFRAERVSARDLPFRAQLEELARMFGAGDVEVWATPAAPRVCQAISCQPVALLVGRELFAPGFDAAERLFLLARALKIARANLVAAVRAQPADLAIAVAGMMRHYDPNHAPPGFSPASLDDAAKRFGKALPRKVRDELLPSLHEMLGAPQFDVLRLGAAASELGDRAALLATGSVPTAVSALLRVAGAEASTGDPRRADAVRKVAAARALVAFAMSDAHSEARQRTGVDRR